MSRPKEPIVNFNPDDLLRRPPGQLLDFPVNLRWELTRRHPLYLLFWSDALLYSANAPANDRQRLCRQVANHLLGAIGVTGEPIDPCISAEELIERDTDPAFLTGSVQPMTLRSMIATLIPALPLPECAMFGALLAEAAGKPKSDETPATQKLKVLGQLARIPSAALDSCPEAPLFYIHLRASQRTIVRDAEDQVRRWKHRRGLTEPRLHTQKLPLYLDVWDRREGWAGGRYDRSNEQKLPAIAKALKISISTAFNRYRAAFEMITGHSFSPETWSKLFGQLKIGEILGDPVEAFSAPTRRRLQSATRRAVPDTVVSPKRRPGRGEGVVESQAIVPSEQEHIDLVIDIRSLIAEGFNDEAIARKLDLPDSMAVGYIRGRLTEFTAIGTKRK